MTPQIGPCFLLFHQRVVWHRVLRYAHPYARYKPPLCCTRISHIKLGLKQPEKAATADGDTNTSDNKNASSNIKSQAALMFWRFGFQNASAIDALLDKEDVTLEEILDDDDLLQECKAHNTKLIE